MKSLDFINSQACYFPIDVCACVKYEYMHTIRWAQKKEKFWHHRCVCVCVSVSELEWIIYWTS